LYPGDVAWHFVTVPQKEFKDIQKRFGMLARGWGSLPVMVTIGKTTWKTSIFPDKKTGTYLLPLKVVVRKQENIHRGDTIAFALEILVDYTV
jgi:hypothetical protein